MTTQLAPGHGFARARGQPPQLWKTRQPAPAPAVPEPEPASYAPEPLWLRLPPELSPWFNLGFCHSDHICPLVVMQVTDESNGQPAEITGPLEAFAGLARQILALCEAVPCLAGCAPEQPQTG